MTAHPAPEYLKLKRHILGRIAAGDWQPGERIPSEGELTREFGLSRMTVNRALRELAVSGAITRVQGVGSFVAGPKAESTMVEVHGIRDEIRQRGQQHAATVLSVGETHADAALAEAFGLPLGAPLYHSLLLHCADGQPLQLEDRYVNPAAAPGYLQQDLAADTPHHYLTRVAPLEQAEHVIEADTPSPEVARHLQLQPHEPVLVLNRRTWSGGRVASVARLFHPARRFRLSGRFSFTQPDPG
ncbi:histidine utilization repressor [Schlegelella sp. S2-27]|uniref:Histidine utilization repressor n=1 Tax=Caldimonas mangrovi TaxID=2944811 RepID=A0ABT0YQQ2_9BURK|nr:histidine utilization repressor [Caldimonas mangrovi]MCM5681070.1 histidine utilization repressor [Caldimonas mangrovi]